MCVTLPRKVGPRPRGPRGPRGPRCSDNGQFVVVEGSSSVRPAQASRSSMFMSNKGVSGGVPGQIVFKAHTAQSVHKEHEENTNVWHSTQACWRPAASTE